MSNVWDGLRSEEMAGVYERIGPSIRQSPTAKVSMPIEPNKLRGKVEKFNGHINDCHGETSLRRGQLVTFDIGQDRKNLPIAVNVGLIKQ